MKKASIYLAFLFSMLIIFSCQNKDKGTPKNKEDQAATSEANLSTNDELAFTEKMAENRLKFPFIQEPLPYSFDALEPYIDKKTMEIHFSKHHAAYTEKFNKAVEENNLTGKSLLTIFKEISKYPAAVRNNGGGFYNHELFWKVMSPRSDTAPQGKLLEAINAQFGNVDSFEKVFSDAAKNQFGSGWAWLIVTSNGRLAVISTPNQDNPLMDVIPVKGIPLLNLDVWEHAYYLKYQNKRADYVENFWKIVNWKEVERRYEEAVLILKK